MGQNHMRSVPATPYLRSRHGKRGYNVRRILVRRLLIVRKTKQSNTKGKNKEPVGMGSEMSAPKRKSPIEVSLANADAPLRSPETSPSSQPTRHEPKERNKEFDKHFKCSQSA